MKNKDKEAELKWHDFEKIHVISRLRKITKKWWNIQLHFTDAKGYLRGVPKGKIFDPFHPLIQMITNSDKGFKDAIENVRKITIESKSAKKPKLGKSSKGFSFLSVPIVAKDTFLGCAFSDGFIIQETQKEQRLTIKNYLDLNFKDLKESEKLLDTLPVLSKAEVNYLTELLTVVVDEFLMTQSNLEFAKKEVLELKTTLSQRFQFANMVGKSKTMQELYSLTERVANSNSLVLIQGENGTGKELIAKALHFNSQRSKGRFVVVNCGAFNDNLLESELFGHVKGSFTGANTDKVGLFEAANDGTLFLDEIGEMTPSMQVKLLRVLQQQTYTPVGSTKVKKTTARVVCATNRDLAKMVEKSEFREDLFYRLNVINLIVPPLRERKEDIPLLIEHFLTEFANQNQSQKKSMPKNLFEIFLNHDWPGNIRELENEIERLCVLAGNNPKLEEACLSPRIKNKKRAHSITSTASVTSLKHAVEELEKTMILEGLQRTKWNKSKLAKELGISRAGLIMKVEKYQLEKRTAS